MVLAVSWGVLVIDQVDNLLRPLLVGKDTRMPDWVVLMATLGGMAVFGINGFVIGPMLAAMFAAALPGQLRSSMPGQQQCQLVDAQQQRATQH